MNAAIRTLVKDCGLSGVYGGRNKERAALKDRPIFFPESHAVGVVRHRCGPVGENADDADLARQDIQRLVHVAVLPDGLALRIEQIVEAGLRRPLAKIGALECPGDDVEAQSLDVQRVLRRHDFVARIDGKQREHRRCDDFHAFLFQLLDLVDGLPRNRRRGRRGRALDLRKERGRFRARSFL